MKYLIVHPYYSTRVGFLGIKNRANFFQRRTKEDLKHRLKLVVLGVAMGKWTGPQAYKHARDGIKKALEIKNSGEYDDSECKHDQTGSLDGVSRICHVPPPHTTRGRD